MATWSTFRAVETGSCLECMDTGCRLSCRVYRKWPIKSAAQIPWLPYPSAARKGESAASLLISKGIGQEGSLAPLLGPPVLSSDLIWTTKS